MFAVIKSGGKQYRVAPEQKLALEKLTGEPGDTVTFEEVLMLGGEGEPQIGAPLVDGASVAAEIVEQARGPKIIVFKKRRRQKYRRKKGHRQDLTVVRITDILAKGEKPKAKSRAKAKDEKPKADEKNAEASAGADVSTQTPLFEAPTGSPDDLKVISGIGPALEKKLHALGLVTYEQIANLSDEEKDQVEDVLSFKGRFEREKWMEQARELASKKS